MNYPIDKLHLLTLNVGLANHHGDWNWKNVRSPFARLYYVTEGTAQIEMPSGVYTLTPHHLYFIPAYTKHSYICDSTFSHYYIHIYEDLQSEMSILEQWDYPMEVNACNTDLELVKRLCFINPFLKLPQSNPDAYDNHQTLVSNLQLNQRRPFCDKVESRGILFVLMSRFLKYATPKAEVRDDRIQVSLDYIRKNIGSRLDIDLLADKACMSKDHYIRVFKRETGETPNVYITKRKLEKAELSLVTTALPIKSIADSLGYDDYSYFNRIFKKNAGVTPLQYRESHFE
ncbi:helix-turn-helix domain-containing protein [Prevotella sp. ne3005]|jgi:AraC-like DNA-binding protein|uniref:AraC family transcriptional regulator n=1 Tax=Prevotella sp. ne3005 TaxID=1761887 RepID=UPI000B817444|nr:helix-turn-helix domain-containing protein [Prevotella sp. ne3005]